MRITSGGLGQHGLLGTFRVERFKQKIQWIVLKRDMLAVIDGCKAADFVMFVLSAKEEVDAFGESLIRSIETQGVSNTFTVVQHLETVEPAKRRPDIKKSLLSYISHFFPTTTKIYETDPKSQDAPNLLRSLCTTTPKGIHWRDDRSYLVAEAVRYEDEKLVVSGIVRGRGLKADRLVHIQGYGDFQIEKVLLEFICTRLTFNPDFDFGCRFVHFLPRRHCHE
jgi:pre-rRNA-processing protein TSR1